MERTNPGDNESKLRAGLSADMGIGETAVRELGSANASEALLTRIESARKTEFETKVKSLTPEVNSFYASLEQADWVEGIFKANPENIDKAKKCAEAASIEEFESMLSRPTKGSNVVKKYGGMPVGRPVGPVLKNIADQTLARAARLQKDIAMHQAWWMVNRPGESMGLQPIDRLIRRIDKQNEDLASENTAFAEYSQALYLSILELRSELTAIYTTVYRSFNFVVGKSQQLFTTDADSANRLLTYLELQTKSATATPDGKPFAKLLVSNHKFDPAQSVISAVSEVLIDSQKDSLLEDFLSEKLKSDNLYQALLGLSKPHPGTFAEVMQRYGVMDSTTIRSDYAEYVRKGKTKILARVKNVTENIPGDTKFRPPALQEIETALLKF